MSRYYTLLTEIGLAKEVQARANDALVELTHIALGDAQEYDPTIKQTALVNEVCRLPISRVYVNPADTKSLCIECTVPEEIGGFFIREAGIYDADGDLFAIAKYPETYKPILGDGSSKNLYIRFILSFTNAPYVQLFVNPDYAVPSKSDVNELIDAKLEIYDENVANKDLSNLTAVGQARLSMCPDWENRINFGSPFTAPSDGFCIWTTYSNGRYVDVVIAGIGFGGGGNFNSYHENDTLTLPIGKGQSVTYSGSVNMAIFVPFKQVI